MGNDNDNEQMMSWNTILSKSRTKEIDSMNPEFAGDYGAANLNNYPFEFDCFSISSCSAIRAMQDKTQVFAFGSSNFCRTRLTHSIEVASTASSIISMIGRNDPPFFRDDEEKTKSDFEISLKEKTKNNFEISLKEKTKDNFEISLKEEIKDVVYAAGLLHDIGNPPFGHMGEQYLSQAIITWLKNQNMIAIVEKEINFDDIVQNNIIEDKDVLFLYPKDTNDRNEGKLKYIKYKENEFIDKKFMQDLINIEGNAQGIRYLIADTPIKELGTIKPTYAVLSSLMKYTSNQPNVTLKFSDVSNTSDSNLNHIVKIKDSLKFEQLTNEDDSENNQLIKNPVYLHKKGFYLSEEEKINTIFNELKISKINNNYVRNPLAYILEAADDISYRTADFEDALLKGIIKVENIEGILKKHLGIDDENWESLRNKIKSEYASFDKISKELSNFVVGKSQELRNLRYDAAFLLRLILKIENCKIKNDFNKFHEYLHEWVTQLKTQLIFVAAWSFQENIKKIMNGTFSSELLSAYKCYHKDIMLILKKIMVEYVYNSDEVSLQNRQAKFLINKVWSNLTGFIKNKDSSDFDNDEFKTLPIRLQQTLIELKPAETNTELKPEETNTELKPEETNFLYYELRIIIDFICSLGDEEVKKLANWEVLNSMVG